MKKIDILTFLKITFEKFWAENKKNLPKLFECVCKYNIIPASSVSSETSFSEANYIERKERSRLAPKTLKHSMLAKQIEKITNILELL